MTPLNRESASSGDLADRFALDDIRQGERQGRDPGGPEQSRSRSTHVGSGRHWPSSAIVIQQLATASPMMLGRTYNPTSMTCSMLPRPVVTSVKTANASPPRMKVIAASKQLITPGRPQTRSRVVPGMNRTIKVSAPDHAARDGADHRLELGE